MINKNSPLRLLWAAFATAGIALAGGAQAQDPAYYAAPGLTLLDIGEEAMLERRTRFHGSRSGIRG